MFGWDDGNSATIDLCDVFEQDSPDFSDCFRAANDFAVAGLNDSFTVHVVEMRAFPGDDPVGPRVCISAPVDSNDVVVVYRLGDGVASHQSQDCRFGGQ